jgi:antitoxin ParD1/3/4
MMNVSLTPQLEEWIQQKVATGRYGSASEVVREALRLLEARDRAYQARLADLRQAIQAGIDSGPAEPLERAQELLRQARAYHAAQLQGIESDVEP